MRLVATADCHLGFRAYARTSSSGLNQREVDVAPLAARLRESSAYQGEELEAFVAKGIEYLRQAEEQEALKVIAEPVTPERSEAA